MSRFRGALGASYQLASRHTWAVRIVAGEEASDVVRFTLQAVDRQQFDRPGIYRVAVTISETPYGPPGGTQSVSIVTGTLLRTIEADRELEILTNTRGLIELDIDAGSGAQVRHVHAAIIGEESNAGGAWS